MKKIIFTLFITTAFTYTSFTNAETIPLEKQDYIKLLVGNYVNGFNEFDTTIVTSDGSVSIAIYYDWHTQDGDRADKLADRFRLNVPKFPNKYDWAKDVSVNVSVYSEDDDRGD